MEKIYIEKDKLSKIKLTKSVRVSMLDLEELDNRGVSVAEALRVGLDMVLGRVQGPAPVVDRVSEEVLELWELHRQYLDAEVTAERPSLGKLEAAWCDFIMALDDIDEKHPQHMEDYYNKCFAKIESSLSGAKNG